MAGRMQKGTHPQNVCGIVSQHYTTKQKKKNYNNNCNTLARSFCCHELQTGHINPKCANKCLTVYGYKYVRGYVGRKGLEVL